ncbi:MAG: ribosome-binding factor [Verrucomicrobiota bacterium]|jgi:ribosome-binding factor A
MASHRIERVRELLKRGIGEAIRRELPVDQAGLVTVSDVDVGGDLKSATVFISILGGQEQQRTGLLMLQNNRGRIQGLVAKSVLLKYVPQLRFVVDDSVTRGNRVIQILEELEKLSPDANEANS